MKSDPRTDFEGDDYLDSLIIMRREDPVSYRALPQAVREVVEQYEREKEVANRKKQIGRACSNGG